jgi:hypothetical protein
MHKADTLEVKPQFTLTAGLSTLLRVVEYSYQLDSYLRARLAESSNAEFPSLPFRYSIQAQPIAQWLTLMILQTASFPRSTCYLIRPDLEQGHHREIYLLITEPYLD